MVRRNELCVCGSGKKYKRCCLGKNSRSTSIKFDFGRPVHVDNLSIDPVTKEISAFSGTRLVLPNSVTSEQSYVRSSGKPNKVISKIFRHNNAHFTQPVKNLAEFDCVYAVDTNYKIVNGVKVCGVGVTRGEKTNIQIPGKTAYSISLKYGIVFSTMNNNPERVSWGFVADQARYWENIQDKNVGLIVDSDLGCLEEISEGKQPLFLNIFLPDNFTLMYASADAESGNPMNKMIKYSDYGATMMLNELMAQLGTHDVSKSPVQPNLQSITQNGNEITFREMPIVQEIGAAHA